MFKKIACVSALLTTTAFAQNISSVSQMKMYDSKKFTIALDGASLLLKGGGIKATYAVAESVSLGGIAKSFELGTNGDNDNSIFDIKTKHKVDIVGVVADFFPMGTASERGLYISGAITSANVKTNVDYSYFGSYDTSKDSKTGAQLTVGYQFIIHLGNSANIMFQTGAGYGNAGGVKWTSLNNKTELRDSLQLDLIGGAQF